MTEEKAPPSLKDLVVLMYASNTCFTTVCSAKTEQPRLEIDPAKGVWTFDGRQYRISVDMRRCEHGCRGGVIGVYDPREVQHINTMIRHSQEALERPMSFHEAEYS
ncbi:MAG: hypothetical protein Q7S47_01515 [bacterium]|nr:hypothetical protein [bacterium]